MQNEWGEGGMRIAVVFFLMMAMVSCKRECTKVIDTYENGKPKEVHVLADCSDSTTYTRLYYYENGQLSSEAQYANGRGNGKCKSWYENGIQSAEWQLLDGKEHGFIQCWNETGIKVKETVLDRGLENGAERKWGDDGKIAYEGNYRDGKMHGQWKYYDENGFYIRNYSYGSKEGGTYEKWIDTSTGDVQIVIGQYVADKEDGLWKWFTKDSILNYSVQYKEGVTEGEVTYYYRNGNVESKGTCVNDQLEGERYYYSEEGKLTKIKYYDKGKLIRTKKL